MKRVVILGGYGGFGSRIAELLLHEGFAPIVAGRSLDKAQIFANRHPGCEAARLDRETLTQDDLAGLNAWALVDAAGPFQANELRLPRVCIAARCHYLDIADARDFVAAILALDAEAQDAGISIIGGASSVPALTAAAADTLAEGLDRVTRIETMLSASNRAAGSASITDAVLSYAGKPVRLWQGGQWRTAPGGSGLARVTFDRDGKPYRRLVALCDVPDHDLLPRRYPGAPAVRFRAGTEIALQMRGMALAAWLVRRGLIGSGLALQGPARLIQRAMRRIGGARSAMRVELTGWRGGEAVKRCWELRAERGDGPWVPCLAVPVILARLRDGAIEPGARDAAGLVTLADYERMSAGLAIAQETREHSYAPPYARVMREDFAKLPPAVRTMHEVAGEFVATGEASVERGKNPLAWTIGAVFGFPDAGAAIPVTVWMDERDGRETWRRDFGGQRFESELSQRGEWLVERFGPFRFGFELRPEADGLSMVLGKWWAGPIRMPMFLAPSSLAREREIDGRFHFDVPIALPLVGRLVHYRGWLAPASPVPDA